MYPQLKCSESESAAMIKAVSRHFPEFQFVLSLCDQPLKADHRCNCSNGSNLWPSHVQSTHGLLFRCVYTSLKRHLENAPCALLKRKRKRWRECRLKEFIFTSLTWDCWFFFIHSICAPISFTLPPSPFISRLFLSFTRKCIAWKSKRN